MEEEEEEEEPAEAEAEAEEEEEEIKTERRSRKAVAHYTGTDLKMRHLPPATHSICR